VRKRERRDRREERERERKRHTQTTHENIFFRKTCPSLLGEELYLLGQERERANETHADNTREHVFDPERVPFLFLSECMRSFWERECVCRRTCVLQREQVSRMRVAERKDTHTCSLCMCVYVCVCVCTKPLLPIADVNRLFQLCSVRI